MKLFPRSTSVSQTKCQAHTAIHACPPSAFRRLAPLALAALVPLAALRAQSNYATPYTFTTLAGLASAGSTDGTGTAARFSGPIGVTVDSSGSLYIADTHNNLVRKMTPAGVVTTLAGSVGSVGSADGTGSAAQFSGLNSIAVDGAGNAYVATKDSTIRQITPAGVVTTIAGSVGQLGYNDGTGSAARFIQPFGIAADPAGNLYVADRYTIRLMTPTVADGITNWVVTTIAGNFYPGSTDGTGSAAQFDHLTGIAMDGAGSLYVADSYNYTIRKITPTVVSGTTNWAVTTLAGSAGNNGTVDATGSDARFSYQFGVAVDGAGNVYCEDRNMIRQITPAGVVTTICSPDGGSADGTGSAASFLWPEGITADSAGNLYVADTVNNTIRKMAPTVVGGVTNWVVTTIAGSAASEGFADGTGSAARFAYPEGAAVDSAGNVYIVDTAYALIRQITPAGVVTTIAGVPIGAGGYVDGPGNVARFSNPVGIAVDKTGSLYVADLSNNTIREITPTVVGGITNWVVTTIAGAAGTENSGSVDGTGSAARFNHPRGVAVDGAGNVYVADSENYTIRKITPTVVSGVTNWVVTTLAGSAGIQGRVDDTGSAAGFDYPNSITVDSAGNLYVTDDSIRKITPAGVVTTIAGATAGFEGSQDGTGSAARFVSPQGIAVDGAGNLYVADTMNNTIRKMTPSVVGSVTNWDVTTLAGSVASIGSTDGTGPAAQFNYPAGIAADSAGNVYVADTENNTIRKGVLPSSAPAITAQPVSETVTRGFNASFTATVDGTPVPAIQWQVSTDGGSTWTDLQETGLYSGVTTATLTITGPALSMSGYQYKFVATNSIDTVTSAAVTLTVSPAAAPVGSISAGFESTFFLKTDGTLWATGHNFYGQLGDGTTTDRSNFEQVATGVTSVAAADSHTMFVKTDHTLWAMGRNEVGQLGDGTTTDRHTPVQVASGVASVAVGSYHTLFVKTDGTLWAVGNNNDGQLGDGTTTSRSTPEQVATGVASVSAGYAHTMFVKTDGTLWAAGMNNRGQLGDGTTANRSTPEQIATGVASVAAGDAHTLFVKTDETLWATGLNSSGQLGDGTPTTRSTFEQVASGVISVAAGVDHTMFLKSDGTLWGMGDDYFGELGDGAALASTTTTYQSTPEQVASGVVSVATGNSYTMFLKSDGSLWATGNDFSGELGDGAPIPEDEDIMQARSTPVKVLPLASVSFTTQPINQTIALGNSAMLTATATGTPPPTLQWQVSTNGGSTWTNLTDTAPYRGTATGALTITGVATALSGYQYRCVATNVVNAATSSAATLMVSQTGAKVRSVAGGSAHSMVLMTDGTLWATGDNYAGGLGDGTTTDRSTWEQVASGVTSVACGYLHTVFIKSDGTLWAMGSNGSGQLGDGTTTDRYTPVQVATGVASVATGATFTLFIKTDGTLWAMGYNGWGQLGTGNTTNQSTPIQIASGVASVAAGSLHTVFLKTDGTLWGTGNNGNGELGDGTTAGDGSTSTYGVRTTPEQMASGVASISAGIYRTLFIKTDGTLWATGWNYYGQLGDGTGTTRTTPVQVGNGVASVSAGGEHTLFIKTDGTLWATGSNTFGQLGDGTTTDRHTPVQMATSVASVSAGGSHTLFVKTDGTLWAMGDNQNGQLGDGTTIDRSTPEQLIGSTNVAPSFPTQPTSSAVTAGGNASFTIAASGTPPPTLKWQVSTDGGTTWTNLTDTAPYSGTTTGTLTITGATAALNGDQFRCVITNGVGPDVTSLPATLTVFSLSNQAFLQQLYLDVLGRPIDAGGAAFFGAALTNGESRPAVLGDLLGSQEYGLRQIDPVIRLYYSALVRCPDSAGLQAWSSALNAGATTLAAAGDGFAGSAEFLQEYGTLDNTQFVQQIYLNALGRRADAAGLANCVAYLNAGGSRGSVLVGISESPEGQANLANRVEAVRLYFLLLKRMPTPAELQSWLGFLQGSDETDVLFASGYPTGMTDSSYVQLVFSGFLRRAAGASELSTFGGALTAQTISHGSLVTTLLTSSEFDAYVAPVARLYLGALLRAPDSGGLDNWAAFLRAGNSLQAAADAYAASQEFADIYGAMSNSDYVSALYLNILGRHADATGLANWTALLNGGASRGQVLIGLSESPEAAARLAPMIRTALSYLTFLSATPGQADLNYWDNYLSTLDDQFRDILLADPTFASGG